MNKEGTGLWGGVLGKLLFCKNLVAINSVKNEQGRGFRM